MARDAIGGGGFDIRFVLVMDRRRQSCRLWSRRPGAPTKRER